MGIQATYYQNIFSKNIRSESFHIFLGFFLFLLCFLSNNFSAPHDAIGYLNGIESGTDLFRPHHLLFHIMMFEALRVLKMIMPSVPNHFIIESINALWGAMSLAVVYFIFRRRFNYDPLTAFIGTCLPAFSFGFWFYSTNIEVYVVPLFFLLLCVLFLSKERLSKRDLHFVIAFHVLAILFHQVNILFTPIIIWKIWQQRKVMPFTPMLLRYALLGGGIVILAYVSIGIFVLKHQTLDDFFRWIQGYTKHTYYWTKPGLRTLGRAAVGLTHAFVGAHFLFKVNFIENYLKSALPKHNLGDELFLVHSMTNGVAMVLLFLSILLFVAVAYLTVVFVMQWKRIYPKYETILLPLLQFFSTYSVFFYFWMPENLEFWIPQTVVFWLMLAGSLKELHLPLRMNRRVLLGTIAVLLFAINYFGSIKWMGDFKNDLFYQKAQLLNKATTQQDLILLKNKWIILDYLDRYTKTPTLEIPERKKLNEQLALEKIVTDKLDSNGKVFINLDNSAHAVDNQDFIDSLLRKYKVTYLPTSLSLIAVIQK